VLRARLLDEHPERIRELQRRASAWFADNDQPTEAVEHAVRAEDFVLAAALVEKALPSVRRDRRDSELRRWLEALPDELVRASPVLTVAMVGALMAQGVVDGVETRLQDAERLIQASADVPGALDGQLRTLPSDVAMYRAAQARMLGDVAGTIQHARRAYELSAGTDHLERGAAAALLGLAHWSSAQLDDAHRCYTEALDHLSEVGHVSDVLGCTLALSDMDVARGQLDAAAGVLQRGLRRARETARVPRGTADMHVGLAALHVERNQLDAALRHLTASDELGEHAGLPQNAYRSRVVRAQIRLAQNAPDEALLHLEDAARVFDSDFSPVVRPVEALIARVWIAQGRTDQAQDWAAARRLSADDEPTYVREYEHLTLARLLLARTSEGDSSAAARLAELLDRMRRAAGDQRRPGSVLDTLVLAALLAQQQGDLSRAGTALHAAVELAEPQRYVRTITEHGPPVLRLLRSLAGEHHASYARRLLESAQAPSPVPVIPRQALPDRLSDRELEVLQLLASDLDGPDIARHLVVSVHTVRTHTKAIYAKLGVNNRRAAVSRARELELLHSTS
jgi:LuxR family maltose regulon positive regulatory protein